MANDVVELLGKEAEDLLNHTCTTVPKKFLHLPGEDFVDRVMAGSDRSVRVLRNMQTLLDHGRLGRTGYVSILPVDQGIEHSAGASFAPNPLYFDPEQIVRLAIEGGCNGVASTLGVLGAVARKYAHKIPFILKFNHNVSRPGGSPSLVNSGLGGGLLDVIQFYRVRLRLSPYFVNRSATPSSVNVPTNS